VLWSSDQLLVTHGVELLAWCATKEGDYEAAASLFGAADRMWAHLGGNFSGFRAIAWHRDRCLDEAKRALSPSGFEQALAEGSSMSRDAVLEWAVRASVPAATDDSGTPLTTRELEVARLVARGLTNRDIAERLTISTRTVESHVEHILTKLRLPNRTQVATWIATGAGQS
jgi:DNA-binding CsgD family transcriptional regulator